MCPVLGRGCVVGSTKRKMSPRVPQHEREKLRHNFCQLHEGIAEIAQQMADLEYTFMILGDRARPVSSMDRAVVF